MDEKCYCQSDLGRMAQGARGVRAEPEVESGLPLRPRLALVGGCRDASDGARVEALRRLAADLGIQVGCYVMWPVRCRHGYCVLLYSLLDLR